MADTDEPTTDDTTAPDPAGREQDTSPPDTAAGDPAPDDADPAPADAAPAVDLPSADQVGTDQVGTDQVGTDQVGTDQVGTDQVGTEEAEEAAAEELRLRADAETLAAAAIPPSRPAGAEPEAPRFGAQFSSPEPTTVTARPRRRATRPALSADPESVEPAPAAAPTLPAFITFVAPPEEAEEAPAPPRRRSRRAQAETPAEPAEPDDDVPADATEAGDAQEEPSGRSRRSRSRRKPAAERGPVAASEEDAVVLPAPDAEDDDGAEDTDAEDREADDQDSGSAGSRRRRRGRRGRGRGRSGEDEDTDDRGQDAGSRADQGAEDDEDTEDDGESEDSDEPGEGAGSSTRRRRRRRRRGESAGDTTDTADDDRPERAGRNGRDSSDDAVRGVAGSTRLEAKRQRRRDGRDTGRRRAPILSESEFLARREAVDRAMVIRQQGERTQIAVLEDGVLVEHYVTQAQSTSFAGNVYLGRVQNVLPSMEAAFVDIGKGRNAVLYAGEVNWETVGLSGKSRSIEQALKSGDKVLCQVTKDPIGHKGARLTQQINLPGRFLVYVPGGSMTGISRKLPDNERQRLKDILKKIVPEDAGVIIRTAAEGASEEELTRDVARLQAQWEVIQTKASAATNAPTLLYGEPDLAIRVIRDVFNEDFKRLVVQGSDAWDTVEAYVAHVSPELSERLERHIGTSDVFRDLRIDEQLLKALDRKVWLPSGGSLVIDRTEAMTVVDVNTGKFVGSGGNLEQTVTRNNIEAAEEIVRQLRLRDIGGMIVIDFIDMVLESNRELVLRRLTECLGRDRTKHQVAEVTSLGLVQMTRKRVGQGLLEVFSEPCEHCRGRGVLVQLDPVDERKRSGGSGGGGNGPGNAGSRGRDAGRGGDRPVEVAVDSSADDEAAGAPDDSGDAQPESSGRSGRRNRGRRNRGRNGDEQVAEDAAVLDASRGSESADDQEAADPVQTEQVVEDADGQLAVDTDTGTDVVEPTDDGDATSAEESGAVTGGEVGAVEGQTVLDLPDAAGTVTDDTAGTATEGDAAPDPEVSVAAEVESDETPATATDGDAGPEPTVLPNVVEPTDAPGLPEWSGAEPVPPAAESPVARPRRRRGASRPAGPPA